MIVFTALTIGINPPSNVERIDPKTLHLSGEFAEQNLGTAVERDGSVTARVIATQFMFVPRCIAVPQGRRVTLRFASPDVIHGIPDHRHQCEHDGRAGLCRPGAYRVHPHRRPADAVPRVLRARSQRDVGDRAGLARRRIQAGSGRESDLCATLNAFVWRISGWRSPPSSPLPCSARGRCGCAARWAPHIGTPGQYFMSVTAHGVVDGLRADDLLHHGLRLFRRRDGARPSAAGKSWAWAAFWMAIVGVVMAVIPIVIGHASVLFTFYPPLTASPWFYIGLVLVVVASWIWCVLMIVAMREWKRENPGRPVPLAMFATVANAVMWLWTTVGVAVELLFQVIPAALGLVQTIDVGPVAHAVLLDAARDRLFLADPGLYRVLHDGAARRWRTALQRHDGPADLHSVPDLQPAGRHASSADGPRARQRIEIHSGVADGASSRCRRC